MTRRIPDRATLRAALRESSVTEWYAVHYEHLRECGPVEAAWDVTDELNWFVVAPKHRRYVRLGALEGDQHEKR